MRDHKLHDPPRFLLLPGNRWCQAIVAAGVIVAAATLTLARSGTEIGSWHMLAAFLGSVAVVAGVLVFRADDSSGKSTPGTYLAGAAGAFVFSFLFFRSLFSHSLVLDYVGAPGSGCRYEVDRDNPMGGILSAGLVALLPLVLSLRSPKEKVFAALKSVEFMAFAGAMWLSLVGGVGLVDAMSRLDARVVCNCYSDTESMNSGKISGICPDLEARCRTEAEAPKPKGYVECAPGMPARPAAELFSGAIAVLGIASAWAIRARAGRRRRWLADVRADKVPGWRLTRSMPDGVNGSPSVEATFTLVSHGHTPGYRDEALRDVSEWNIPEDDVSDAPGKYVAENALLTATFWLLLCAVVIFFVVSYFAAILHDGN